MKDLIRLIDQITPGPVLNPHPAKVLINAVPEAPTMLIECRACGDTFQIPIFDGDAPNNTIPREVISCPACGCYSETVLEILTTTPTDHQMP